MLVAEVVALLHQGQTVLEVLEAVQMVVKVVLLVQPILAEAVEVRKETVLLHTLVAMAVLA